MNFIPPELNIKNNYIRESVMDSLLAAEQNLRQVKDFIALCKAQIEVIKGIKFHKEIRIECSQLWGYVFYFVGCHFIPDIKDLDKVIYPIVGLLKFDGKDELDAIVYAEKLAKEHRCEIKKIGVDKP